MDLFQDVSKGAEFSECGKYRYQLWRIWNDKLPKVLFIMLNPSTAGASEDDNTIRRCIGFAKSWGYGGLYVGNIFAYRSTDPKYLLKAPDPVGKENNRHLSEMGNKCKAAVLAWGNPATTKKVINSLYPKYYPLDNVRIPLYYIQRCKDGTPAHPLYLKSDLKLNRWI